MESVKPRLQPQRKVFFRIVLQGPHVQLTGHLAKMLLLFRHSMRSGVMAHWHRQHMQHLQTGHLNSGVTREKNCSFLPLSSCWQSHGQRYDSAFPSSGGSLMVLIKDPNPWCGPIAIRNVWLLLLYRSLSRLHSPLSWKVRCKTTFQSASGNKMGAERYFTMLACVWREGQLLLCSLRFLNMTSFFSFLFLQYQHESVQTLLIPCRGLAWTNLINLKALPRMTMHSTAVTDILSWTFSHMTFLKTVVTWRGKKCPWATPRVCSIPFPLEFATYSICWFKTFVLLCCLL